MERHHPYDPQAHGADRVRSRSVSRLSRNVAVAVVRRRAMARGGHAPRRRRRRAMRARLARWPPAGNRTDG
ncbi:hypothetical protein FTX61_15010 [Nitriliruptoraceae bacterium ZYF776]|nr:hypothetical protein [Profundirhabdus halotolerans]